MGTSRLSTDSGVIGAAREILNINTFKGQSKTMNFRGVENLGLHDGSISSAKEIEPITISCCGHEICFRHRSFQSRFSPGCRVSNEETKILVADRFICSRFSLLYSMRNST